jgi:hypothetical protein
MARKSPSKRKELEGKAGSGQPCLWWDCSSRIRPSANWELARSSDGSKAAGKHAIVYREEFGLNFLFSIMWKMGNKTTTREEEKKQNGFCHKCLFIQGSLPTKVFQKLPSWLRVSI